MMKKNLHAILCALLVFLGLSRMTGEVFGWEPAIRLGQTTVAGPIPMVFYHPELGSDITFHFVSRSGNRKTIPVTAEVFDRIKAPFSVRGTYAQGLFDPLPQEEVDLIYGYWFCHEGKLRADFGLNYPMRSVTIEINNDLVNPSIQKTFHTRCLP